MTALTPAEVLDQIAARADAATDGPWDYDPKGGPQDVEVTAPPPPSGGDRRFVATTGDPHYDGTREDADFIAHARTDVPRLVAALRAVLALHKPVTKTAVACGDDECEHEKCRRVEVTICAACDETCSAAYYYYAESNLDAAEWPCATVAVIASALGGEA